MPDIPQSYLINRRAVLSRLLTSFAALAAIPAVADSLARLKSQRRIGNRAIGIAKRLGPLQVTAAFSEQEQAIVARLVEIIVPSDELPGARETGTAATVLFTLGEQDALVIEALRQAIAAVDAISMQLFGQPYVTNSVSAAEQVTAVIVRTPQLDSFWSSVRNLTVLDFYADEAGYEPLGMPGPTIDQGGFPDGRSTSATVLCKTNLESGG